VTALSDYWKFGVVGYLIIQRKLASKAKGNFINNENGQKMHCNANKKIAQLTVTQRQRKREITATVVFVCTGR